MEPQTLAPYVLRILARYQINGRPANLQTLVDELGVRRADLRRTVSVLDQQEYLDALTMRLTLSGFAIGVKLLDQELRPLRRLKLRLLAA